MLPDVDNPGQWLDKALADMRAAQNLLSTDDADLVEIACFHIQQAIEKALKAVLISAGCVPRRTHDLRLLCDEIDTNTTHGNILQPLRSDLQATAIYAVTYRYPTTAPPPTHDDARTAMQVLERLISVVNQIIEDKP